MGSFNYKIFEKKWRKIKRKRKKYRLGVDRYKVCLKESNKHMRILLSHSANRFI